MDRKMMQQLQQMQNKLVKAQEELGNTNVDGSAGGGAVRVTMNGHRELKDIYISPDAVDPDDVEMLQDMVMAAVNEALRQAMELQSKATGAGGMDASAAMDMLGGLGGLGGGGGGGGLPGGAPNRAARRKQR